MSVTAPEREQAPRVARPVTEFPMPHVDGVEHHFTDVDGVTIHHAEAGSGEPVVLVHGWPQHWWAWRELIGPLAQNHRVIAPDVRGMGWSDAPRRGYSFEDLADELVRFLDALNLDRVKLVGHDWGIGIGYRAAIDHPERFERFVAMGGPHVWAADGAPLGLYLRAWHIYVNATPLLGALATTRLNVPEACLRYWRADGEFTREEIEIYTAPIRRAGTANATVQRYRTLLTKELHYFRTKRDELRLEVPTLHLNGERDPLAYRMPQNYWQYARDMTYEVVPRAGHFLPEERPKQVLARIEDFFG